ncbi:MAG: hypothetical protein KC535_00490, partial [Nanoarchaeota archaeon]|nr:hypothetical protein [Nanoarchaeota archaeon]
SMKRSTKERIFDTFSSKEVLSLNIHSSFVRKALETATDPDYGDLAVAGILTAVTTYISAYNNKIVPKMSSFLNKTYVHEGGSS